MRQYWTVKSRYLDSLIFMQIGSFYESFDCDANVMHAAIGLTYKNAGKAKVPTHLLAHRCVYACTGSCGSHSNLNLCFYEAMIYIFVLHPCTACQVSNAETVSLLTWSSWLLYYHNIACILMLSRVTASECWCSCCSLGSGGCATGVFAMEGGGCVDRAIIFVSFARKYTMYQYHAIGAFISYVNRIHV